MASAAFRLSAVRATAIRPVAPRVAITPLARRQAHQPAEAWRHREPVGAQQDPESTAQADSDLSDVRMDGSLAKGSAKGVTGGGKPLQGTSPEAPSPPKVSNFSVGSDTKLNKEQQREVDEHNKDFDKRHDRGDSAPEDKVHSKFWKTGET
ncbi:hypothetical protein B0I35DRAFT_480994 [Stachybotrys elegans]|uniref:Uncharacterized protein n=1 Tax=Stachybotrys elegans TaxID=80388 RepID=A0A8K0SMH3_9HYPO|nr:hypothetical protein B0I35DRAFT_480994 [Stachybotrys elegans]